MLKLIEWFSVLLNKILLFSILAVILLSVSFTSVSALSPENEKKLNDKLKSLELKIKDLLAENTKLKTENTKLKNLSTKSTTLPSNSVSKQVVPEKLWGYIDAVYYHDRYERLILEIYTSDKSKKDFVFKKGVVDVVVRFETWFGHPNHSVKEYRADQSHYITEYHAIIDQQINFSESDYSKYNKLVLEIEGCIPAGKYFLEATIYSGTQGFTFNNEFKVENYGQFSCRG